MLPFYWATNKIVKSVFLAFGLSTVALRFASTCHDYSACAWGLLLAYFHTLLARSLSELLWGCCVAHPQRASNTAAEASEASAAAGNETDSRASAAAASDDSSGSSTLFMGANKERERKWKRHWRSPC